MMLSFCSILLLFIFSLACRVVDFFFHSLQSWCFDCEEQQLNVMMHIKPNQTISKWDKSIICFLVHFDNKNAQPNSSSEIGFIRFSLSEKSSHCTLIVNLCHILFLYLIYWLSSKYLCTILTLYIFSLPTRPDLTGPVLIFRAKPGRKIT